MAQRFYFHFSIWNRLLRKFHTQIWISSFSWKPGRLPDKPGAETTTLLDARGWDHHIARCPPPVGVEALSPSDTLLPAWGCSRINCLYLQACASSHSKEKSKVLPVPMALPSVGKMTDQESYRLKKNKSRGNSLWTLFLCIQNRKDIVEGHCFFAKLTLHIICLHNLSGTFSIWI